MKNSVYSSLAILLVFSLMFACKHDPGDLPDPNGGEDPPIDTLVCDSSNVTYQGTVYPILNEHCISCHSGTAPSAGLDFTDYNDVALVAENGSLLGSIKHLPGYSPMPQGADQISSCEIALIGIWVNDTVFDPGGGGIPCDPDTVYFQNDVLPLLQSSCGIAGCHDPGTAQDDVVLTSYAAVMQTADVEPFQPGESDLYEVLIETDPDKRMPPPPRPSLNSDQVDMVYQWIAQGALNNYCESEDCDSINVTFSQTVWPIIQNSCYGCHSGTNPSGGISLNGYTQVKAAGSIPTGSYGSLLGTITYAVGNEPMPRNGNQLSTCSIAQIRKWINDGMPDN